MTKNQSHYLYYIERGENMVISNYMKLFRKTASSRFFKYFLSYIILLVIVIVIFGAVVYKSFISTLRSEVESSNVASLMQIKNTMDIRLKELERTALDIVSNANLKPYKLLDGGFDSLQAVTELRKYKSSNEFIYDIGLYHTEKQNESIYTTNTCTSLDIFFNYTYQYSNWSKKDFLNLVRTVRMPMMRSVEEVMLDRVQTKGIATYIYPVPYNSNNPFSLILFLIEEQVFEDMIKDVLKEYEGYVYIIDGENKPIAYLSEGETDLTADEMLDKIKLKPLDRDVNDIIVNNNNYSVVKLKSNYNNWSYITVMRSEQFMEKVYTKQTLFKYVVFTVVLIGIIIALVLAAENYKPLRRLMEVIESHREKQGNLAFSDEFDFISNSFSEVALQNTGLISQLKSKAGLMKEQLLLNLLRGRINDEDEIKNIMDICGLQLKHRYFSVITFFIDRYDIFISNNDKTIEKLIKFSMVNVIEELAQEFGNAYGVEMVDERNISILLNCKSDSEIETYISQLAYKTKEFFKEKFGFTLTVGIGNVYDGMEFIHQSFLEANQAVYYRLIKGSNSIIFYNDIIAMEKRNYKYPSDIEERLIISVKQGNCSEITQVTLEIKEYIVSQNLAPELVQFMYFGIINSMIKALNEMQIEVNDCLDGEELDIFEAPFETVDDLVNHINGLCTKICSYIKKQKESKNFELRDKIISIINKKYKDSMISLEAIANECGFSPSYVSRYFKDQTGYPLMQYIDLMRINEVKKFLAETNLSLREILSQVGYLDESNFIRKFKKKEGITPIQYRNILQNESKS